MTDLQYQDAAHLLDDILEVCRGRKLLQEAAEVMVQAAIRYARIRVDWLMADTESRQAMDDERTRAHDAFIDACNALSRLMSLQGLDISWREKLGSDRLGIGDFACYIHARLGIKAR